MDRYDLRKKKNNIFNKRMYEIYLYIVKGIYIHIIKHEFDVIYNQMSVEIRYIHVKCFPT